MKSPEYPNFVGDEVTSLISISGGRCSVRDSSRRLLPFAKTRRRNLKMAVGSWELASWHLCALALNSPPFPSAAGQIPVPLAQNQGSTSGDIAARWSLPLFCRSRGDETHFNFGRQMFSQRLLTSSPTIRQDPKAQPENGSWELGVGVLAPLRLGVEFPSFPSAAGQLPRSAGPKSGKHQRGHRSAMVPTLIL
jgi:hypothetical protein